MTPYTPDELIRFIQATGESPSIDAKGPMQWDGGGTSAGQTKDIISFANSLDGGVIVIGKAEPSPGTFDLRGLTPAEADSFETTKGATWVNNHCEPPAKLVCHRLRHEEKEFIVSTVAEFDDVPHLCTKSFQDPIDPKKHLLREGTIYVRTTNAESAPLASVDQLRTLVGLATKKRGQEMLVMFGSMLKGRPLVFPPSDEEQFEKEVQRIEQEFGTKYEQAIQSGAWQLVVHPSSFNPERWPDAEQLEGIIGRRSVRLRDEFPPHRHGTHMREWGLCNDGYRGLWTLTRSGQFIYVRPYPLEHPELRATGKDGKPVGKFGIGCWGYNLCPSKPESPRFMLNYVREMYFDFYPNADGVMIESSDYAICHCPDCGERFFEKEFRFVRQISEEVWAKKPEAMIVVYPHYFNGAEVPGVAVRAAKLPFDPRWTLFFTPHSAHLDPQLIRQARRSLWWDESPALHRPQDIQQGAIRARNAGVTGYVPSLEAYSFVPTEAEEGQAWLNGRRQVPLGFGWLKVGESPYDELPMRVNRIAYREFSGNPDLPFEHFKGRLGREIFGDASMPQLVDDLLELQVIFAMERTWCQPSPVVCPERVQAMKAQGRLTPEKQDHYSTALRKLADIHQRHKDAAGEGQRQLREITGWVLGQWTEENRALLK